MCTRQGCVVLALAILLAVSVKVQSKPITAELKAQIKTAITYSGTVDEDVFRNAVHDFQSFAGLNSTGELDVDTMKQMSLPRCGLRDKARFGYHILGSHWVTKNFTYNVLRYPKAFEEHVVDDEIARAFAVWSESTDLKFTLQRVGPVHINIAFAVGEHGDFNPFDGPGGILAHAFTPTYGGDIHFDDDELWAIGNSGDISIFQVAAHELGHSLGLGHSNIVSSLMHPFYYGYKPNLKLHPNDVRAIEILYGRTNSQSRVPSDFGPPHLSPDDQLCKDPKIDTIFNSTDGETYAFKANIYYKISKTADGYPKRISDEWPGLPGDIDAAFAYKTGKTYFFKGTEYWRYSGRQMDSNFPRRICDDFSGLPDYLDAAMVWNDIIYFYKGSQFWCFEILKKPNVLDGYPKLISVTKGLPDDLDAAIQLTKDVTFYFKGNVYYQVDAVTSTVTAAVPPFPRPLVPWWFSCKNASSRTGFDDLKSDDNVNVGTATN